MALRLKIAWLSLWVLTGVAQADFVIPYELRIHHKNGGISRYSVIVSLADHFRYYFGPQDQLSHFLATSEFRGQHEYLNYVFEWYLNYVSVSEAIYADGGPVIADGRRQHESIMDGFSSAVVLTEYKKPEKILGLLRTSVPDESGRVPVERHYWDLGLGQEGFPTAEPKFELYEEVEFSRSAYNRNAVPLGVDLKKHAGLWVGGGKVELKNFGIPDGLFRRVFPFLYLTGRIHKMYSFDGRPIPDAIKAWPDGFSISEKVRKVLGRRVTNVCLEATGEKLEGMYESLLGVRTWRTLQNQHTGNQLMHFMHASLAEADKKVEENIRVMNRNNKKVWLIYDFQLAEQIHTCQQRFVWETR
ncbi:MAG: hypothetical protein H6617_01325 [Bdellovibrionaceae bacterium]|nr:hypothetical protein [Bdellovibrionales bacterium]MCB9253306.1 hypothetical protein [Pseudobdellovibrionaceae bacterium]